MHTQTPCAQLFVRVRWMLKSYDYSTENNATVSKQLLILGWVEEAHLHLNTLKPPKEFEFFIMFGKYLVLLLDVSNVILLFTTGPCHFTARLLIRELILCTSLLLS